MGYLIVILFAAVLGGVLALGAGKGLFWIGFFLGGAMATILKLSRELKDLRARVSQLENQKEKAPPAVSTRAKVAPANAQLKQAVRAPGASVTPRPEASALASRLSEMRGDGQRGTPAPTPVSRPSHRATAPLEAAPLEAAPLEAAPLEAAPLLEPFTGRERGLSGSIPALLQATNFATRVGIVVLFFGVGFLLKYAADHGVLSIEARLFGVVVGGALIYFFGTRLASTQPNYALLLQGSAIGVWYLASFAAFRLYGLIGPVTAFGILVGLSAFTAWRAVVQNAKLLAIFAVLGGFFAPIMASSGEGNHIVLFTYYSVINAGIVAIARRQSWAVLPLMGFVFTFLIGSAWGQASYQPEFFATVEPFLLLSALFYFCVPLLFAAQARTGRIPLYNNIIVFGTPAIVFVLQTRLVADVPFGDAWSAFLMGVVYLAAVSVLWRQLERLSPVLREAYLGIGIVLVTISLPLALDPRVAGTLWALEAAGGVWLAVRQQRVWSCFLALAILIGSGFLWLVDDVSAGQRLFFNMGTFQAGTITLATLFAAWVLDSRPALILARLRQGVALWGGLWWLAIGLWQINEHLDADYRASAMALFFIGSALSAWGISLKLPWQRLHFACAAMVPGLLLTAVITAVLYTPSAGIGRLVWPLAIVTLYWLAPRFQAMTGLESMSAAAYWVAIGIFVSLGTEELLQEMPAGYGSPAWLLGAMMAVPLLALPVLLKLRLWPPGFDHLHRVQIAAALLAWLSVLFAAAVFTAPNLSPLSYIPLLNPFDIVQLAFLLAACVWWRNPGAAQLVKLDPQRGWMCIAAAGFVLANALLLRLLHVLGNIAFNAEALFKSDLIQTSFSVFWAICGVATVMYSSRKGYRHLWLAGMGLLVVVVIKLVTVDITNRASLEGITAFIGVGLLLMLVGLKSPRPDQDVTATPN